MSYTDADIEAVWEKGRIVQEENPKFWRLDECGAWIGRRFYGNRQSQYGWEIDHINPNGGDHLANLRPLQWDNNASRQDGRLTCPVVANGTNNIRRF